MTKKEKLNVLKAGVSAYTVTSLIGWIKEGGIQFINEKGAYVLKVYKTWGIVDVFRLEGALKDLDVFGGDWILFSVGMFSGVIAMVVMRAVDYFRSEDSGPKTEKTSRGIKVKFSEEDQIKDFQL